MAQRRTVDYDRLTQERRRGKTLAEIAKKHRMSESGVRWATDSALRSRPRNGRMVYLPKDLWDRFGAYAKRAGMSRSALVAGAIMRMLEEEAGL